MVNSAEINQLPASLKAILSEIGSIYVTYLLSNAAAAENQQAQFKTRIGGKDWEQQTFPYQYKCLTWLRAEWSDLDTQQRTQFGKLISNTDVSKLFT